MSEIETFTERADTTTTQYDGAFRRRSAVGSSTSGTNGSTLYLDQMAATSSLTLVKGSRRKGTSGCGLRSGIAVR